MSEIKIMYVCMKPNGAFFCETNGMLFKHLLKAKVLSHYHEIWLG